jgi:hypothetical protein
MTPTLYNELSERDFDFAKHKAFWRDLFSKLTRNSNHLLAFDQVREGLWIEEQHYQGLQTISLDNIVGSEGRSRDFDRAFFPRESRTKERWVSIDQAYYQDVPLPPIELIKVGENYIVRDGNHRVSVARARKQDFIDAYVTELEMSIPV